ncbi:MAG: RNA polymerase factor sigma-54 [Pseudomonadota bacterium]|nr:RNA polymerase factor sigma-54 [Pseudomonadota bacterium]
MKQIPSTKTRQRFKATPQFRNAIGLLQLSGPELHAEIQQAVEANALLEIESNSPEQFVSNASDANALRHDNSFDEDSDWSNADRREGHDDLDHDEDSDINRNQYVAQPQSDVDGSSIDAYEVANPSASLPDHLIWQMNFASLTVKQEAIARAIIHGINRDGMLQTSLDEIASNLRPEVSATLFEIEEVLHVVHELDPPGVGSRNLQECLLIQLRFLSPETHAKSVAIRVLADHFEVFVSQDFNRLSNILNISSNALRQVIELIRSLNPRPGSMIDSVHTEYVKPDAFVRLEKGRWLVELNAEITPRIRISPLYTQPSTMTKKFRSNDYVRKHLRHARLFLQGLDYRNSTLANVSNCIIERQQDFLTKGLSAMKPLTLANIATELGVHVSTVSRITTRKYLMTPQGLFPLKYFFSKAIPTTSGTPAASIAVQDLIRNLIKNEKKQEPLSDDSISKLLESGGIQIARRTVAKYRETMAIPASNQRKRRHWGVGDSSAAE